jgi:hypothetical protein
MARGDEALDWGFPSRYRLSNPDLIIYKEDPAAEREHRTISVVDARPVLDNSLAA